MICDDVRFKLDDDNDIIDDEKCRLYGFRSQKDWEGLCILLNTLEYQKRTATRKHDDIVNVLLEEYEEYNNYIDEYSLIKTDILMDLLEKCGVEYG